MRKIYSGILLLFIFAINTNAQLDMVSNNGQTINTCSGSINAGTSTAGSTYTVTICSDDPDNNFPTISFSSHALAGSDELCIYDGTSIAAPVLACINSGTTSAMVAAQASNTNTTGCITLEYNSQTGGSSWTNTIACQFLCQPFNANVTSTSPSFVTESGINYVNICWDDVNNQSESITFTATGEPYPNTNYALDDNNVTFEWDFGDGSAVQSGVGLNSVTHNFPNQEGYTVTVKIIDSQGCENTNLETIRVRVSRDPDWDETTSLANPNQICLGQNTNVCAYANGVTWNSITPVTVAGTTFLPDGDGDCYTTDLNVSEFNPGQTLDNVNNLLGICMNIEHSYIGDLTMYIQCPDGTEVQLEEQGGGYAYLGDPDQGDGTGPGTGWDYCITPGSTNGTFADEATSGNSLPEGNYSSFEDLSNLIGCPLNGNWTLRVCDNWGSDDGYIFGWHIDFDPSLYPDVWTYTPSYTPTTWSGDAGVVFNSPTNANCVDATYIQNSGTGTQPLTITMTDDFGCTHDTTFVIDITEITSSQTHDDVSCYGGNDGTATITSPDGSTPFSYEWDNGQTSQTATGLQPGTYTGTLTDNNGCIAIESVTITEPAEMTVSLTKTEPSCGTADGTITANVTNGIANFSYSCTGQADVTGQPNSYTFSNLAGGTYTITATDANGCFTTETIQLIEPDEPTATFTYNGNQCLTGNSFNFTHTGTGFSGQTHSWSFPSGTPTTSTAENPAGITWSAAGTYTVEHTVSLMGCTDTETLTIEVYPHPTPNTTTTDASCAGFCDGTATANPGAGTFNYIWSSGAGNTATATGLCAGSHTVTVSNLEGCENTESFTINEPAGLSLIPARTNALCYNDCSGTAQVSVTGGSGSYNYLWDNNETTANAGNLCVGIHTVTVSDANATGCFQTANVTIEEPDEIIITPSIDSSHCEQADGAASVTVTGGTGSTYNYSWSNGNTTNSISNVVSATYTIEVRDANNCIQTETINIPDADGPSATVTSSTPNSCFNTCDGSATVTASGGTGTLTYLWDAGNTPSQTTTDGLCAGTHTVVVTDSEGCSTSPSITISEPDELTALIVNDSVFCNQPNGALTAEPSGGTTPYTYSWNTSPAQSTQTATGLIPGNYTANITDQNGCTTSASGEIINIPGVDPSVKSIIDATCFGYCDGKVVVQLVNGEAPFTFEYASESVISNETSDTLFNFCAGNYTITVTDNNGCTATADVTVGEPTELQAQITASTDVLCSGDCNGTATVSASGSVPAYTYQWDEGTNPSLANVSGLCPGNHQVTITDSHDCITTANINIGEPSELIIATSYTDAHCEQADGTASVTATGGTVSAGYTYNWSSGDTPTQSSTTGLTAAGSPYSIIVTDDNGCQKSESITINDIPAGTASISNTINASCNGSCDGLATVSMSGGTGPFTYNWNTTPAQTNVTATNLCAGSYTVEVTDAFNCVVSAQATITEPDIITNSFLTTDALCYGSCDGSIKALPQGGTPNYNFLWSNNQVTQIASGLCAGAYTVTITDANNCSAVFNQNVNQNPQINIQLENITNANCGQSDGNIDISVSGGEPGGYDYIWSNNATTQDITSIPAGNYTVTVTDLNDCAQTATFNVQNISGPSADINIFENVTCNGLNNGSATITADGGSLQYNYTWNTSPVQHTATATNLSPGNYEATVTDITTGCIATAHVSITEPDPLSINQFHNDPLCNNDCNGEAGVIVAGGTMPYTYQWTGGGSTPTDSLNTGLCAGTYSVVVTDANNCNIIESVTLNNPPFLSLTTTKQNVDCYGNLSGLATVNPTGGTPGYSYNWSDPNNQTTQTASGLGVGTYTVTVSDHNQCSETTSVSITQPTPLDISIVDIQDVDCFGNSTGSIATNITGGTPGYDITWNNGETTQNVFNLLAGSYTINVTDFNDCTTSETVIINQAPQLQSTISATDEECYNACDGTASAQPSGGTAPYTYLWSNLQSGQMINGLCPGQYDVTITDNNGCAHINNANVGGPQLLDIVIVDTVSAHCGQPDGEAVISVIGGISPYTYVWSNGSTSNTAENLLAGAHTVTITDDNGCTAEKTISIRDIAGPEIDSLNINHISCAGDANGSAAVFYSSSTTFNSIAWNTTPQQNTQVAINLSPGNYSVTITDNNGCIASGSATITEPDSLISLITSHQNVSCYNSCNGSATVTAAQGTPPYTYQWNNSETNFSISGLCSDLYQTTVTDNNGCTSTNNIYITQPDSIELNETVNHVSCYGETDGSIIVQASGGSGSGYIYQWYGTNSSNSIAAQLSEGTYSIVVTDPLDPTCSTTETFTIIEPDSIEASYATVDATCGNANGIAYINSISGGTGAYTYLWSPGGHNTDSVTGLYPGTYILQIQDVNECSKSFTVPLNSITPPALDSIAYSDVLCSGDANGSVFVRMKNGTEPYTYNFSEGTLSSQNHNSITQTNMTGGVHTVTVTDADGCIHEETFIIDEPSPVTLHADGSRSICIGQSATLSASASGGTPDYNFVWVPNPTGDSSNVQIVSPITTTDYFVYVVDNNGCMSDTSNINIHVYDPITATVDISDDDICEGEDVRIVVTATGGSGSPYTYWWNGQEMSGVYDGYPEGDLSYEIIPTDRCGSPTDTVYAQVIVHPLPEMEIKASPLEGCEPLLVQFRNEHFNESDSTTYSWEFGDTDSDNNTSYDNTPYHEYELSGSYTVLCEATSIYNCKSTDNEIIRVHPNPVAKYHINPKRYSVFNANVEFIDQSGAVEKWFWDFGDGNTQGLYNPRPEYAYTDTGTYIVTLEVTTIHGCKDTYQDTVFVEGEFRFYAPDAINPISKNDENRLFKYKGVGIDKSNFHIYIYDRWGELIFESQDYDEYWNGRAKGGDKIVPGGSYVWYVQLRDLNGKAYERSGTVTVIR